MCAFTSTVMNQLNVASNKTVNSIHMMEISFKGLIPCSQKVHTSLSFPAEVQKVKLN